MTRFASGRWLIGLTDVIVAAAVMGTISGAVVVLDGGRLPEPATAAPAEPPHDTSTVPAAVHRDPVPTSTTTAVVAPTAPLTGEPLAPGEGGVAQRRVLAVKIDDAPAVAEHPGLEQADIVVELLVEGGLTRYMGLFQSRVPPTVGPVRSVRTTDFDLVSALGVPVLAFSGGNERTVADALRLPAIAFPPDRADDGVYRRDRSLKAPHNLFLSPPALWGRVLGVASPRSPIGGSRPRSPLDDGDPVAGLRLVFSRVTDSAFVWDAAASSWVRFQRGRVQSDGEGRPLAFDNVIVIMTTYRTSPYDHTSPEAVSVGSGPALLLSGGRRTPLVWQRPDPSSPFAFRSQDGRTVDIPAGTSWMALLGGPDATVTEMPADEAAGMLERISE
jgi:hypothetical protein